MAFPADQTKYVITAMNFATEQRPMLLSQGLVMDQINLFTSTGDAILLNWDAGYNNGTGGWRVSL